MLIHLLVENIHTSIQKPQIITTSKSLVKFRNIWTRKPENVPTPSKCNWNINLHIVHLLYEIFFYANNIFYIHQIGKESLQKQRGAESDGKASPIRDTTPPYPKKQSKVGLVTNTRVGHSPASKDSGPRSSQGASSARTSQGQGSERHRHSCPWAGTEDANHDPSKGKHISSHLISSHHYFFVFPVV